MRPDLDSLEPSRHTAETAALVRAIRRAVRSPLGYGGLERFPWATFSTTLVRRAADLGIPREGATRVGATAC
jgi:hypothetical protein